MWRTSFCWRRLSHVELLTADNAGALFVVQSFQMPPTFVADVTAKVVLRVGTVVVLVKRSPAVRAREGLLLSCGVVKRHVFATRHHLQVVERVVGGIEIDVVNDAVFGNFAAIKLPNRHVN